MLEQYLIELLILGFGGVLWWFFRRVLVKMDDLHSDLVSLTVQHGERITRLEESAHRHKGGACDSKMEFLNP